MARLQQLADGIYHLESGSNAGLIVRQGEALAIDCGLDRSASKEIARAVESLGATLTGILITHAHADHFGGAAELVKRSGARVYATSLEAAIVANPLLEPLFLYAGASPVSELLHKFTLAPACPVDGIIEPGEQAIGTFKLNIVALPGHAPQQIGVATDGVFFVADAFLPADTVEKHGIPFCVDIDQAIASGERIRASQFRWYAAGHGPALEAPEAAIAANRERLERIRSLCYEALAEPADAGGVLRYVADALCIRLDNPVAFLLSNTTICAALTSCQKAGMAAPEVVGNRLLWRRA